MEAQNWKRLNTDPAFRARMETRSRVISAVRAFFVREGFLEVETPFVVPVPGMEPHLDPFATEVRRHDGARFAAHLITSPEYSMKKLLAGGLPRIFELARAYRNSEPWDGTHNAEFTMLEWYRANTDYAAMMQDTERMVANVAREVCGSEVIEWQGKTIDLSAPWPRLSVAEAFRKFADIDLGAGIDDPARFRADVESKGVVLTSHDTWDDAFFKLFLRDIEPRLGLPDGAPSEPVRPVILYDYPKSMAALARIKESDPRYAERFEAYVSGIELANAFSELNDAAEQRARLEAEREERRKLGASDYGLDEQFLEAVGMMPPSAGIAFGVDRLVLLLADAATLRDVLYFPSSDLFSNG
ncbi:MAG: hypothetical protein RLZZ324_1039 [Candidatus Parcubacteria bacterium]|jgi:lysyl-tRNA synthetase class 2